MYNLLIMQRQKKKYQNEKLNGIKLARNYSEHLLYFFTLKLIFPQKIHPSFISFFMLIQVKEHDKNLYHFVSQVCLDFTYKINEQK